MEETCKAKTLRWFKVPPEKRGPFVTEKDERQRACRGSRGALSLPGPCTAACWAGHAVCWTWISVPLLRTGGTSHSSPEEMGLLRVLHVFRFYSSLISGTAWVATAGQQQSLSHAWVALAEVQELRRAMVNQGFTELRQWDRDTPSSARLSNKNYINGNHAFVQLQ